MTKTSTGALRVPFGLRENSLVAPGDVVETGLACNCTCPGCGARLITRHGTKRRHFAHHNAPVTDDCVSQAIHSAAIQVLLQAKQVLIPHLAIQVQKYAASGERVERYVELCKSRTLHFENCLPEVTITHPDFGTVRPDVVGYKGGRQLFVEMWYTHQVDDEKKAKLAGLGVPAIEIWLQDLDLEEGFSAIERRVLHEPLRHWLFYPGEEEARRRLEAEVNEEVERLDEIHKHKCERARLQAVEKRAAQALREQRALALALLQREKDDEKYLPFRQKPVTEKERALREKLGIKGEWPYYLRLKTQHNAAIQAPHWLWQASVFYHFIFEKKPLESSFGLVEVTNWVRNWFGETDSASFTVLEAVKRFLFYMHGCGFLKYAGPGSGGTFTVQHSELAPPPHKSESQTQDFVEKAKSALIMPHYENVRYTTVTWAAGWPQHAAVEKELKRWVYMSRNEELKILDALFQNRDHLPTPMEFAALMAQEMPLSVVLNFLRTYSFVE